jgi:UDP:flavonoid glycosyltransferase YjiC (YdhE family)
MRQVRPIVDQLVRDCWAACQDADGLIVSTLGRYCGLHLAEKLGIPCIVAHLHPYMPTSSAPQVFFPSWPRGLPGSAYYNRLTHMLAEHGQWQLLRGPFNRPRQSVLGLPPLSIPALWRRVRSHAPPTLYGYSTLIAPPDDARVQAQITGYWPLAHAPGWRPPAELSAFLERGSPPIYVGFGSMMLGRDGDQITKSIIKTLEQIGQRGILYRGWGELARVVLPPTMIAVDSVPHDWLFPQVRAVVHHGGAGVTSAALRAGVPAVVVPFLGDQHFWAERIVALGAGPAPIPRAQLSAERLEQALAQVLHTGSMRERAAAIGQRLRAERGVDRAVDLIGTYLDDDKMTR